MTYSDAEIRASYARAKDKEAQVEILAQLNAVSVGAMEEKLAELGLRSAPPKKTDGPQLPEPRRARPAPFDELRAMELYNEGLLDLDIAERLGVSVQVFGKWRRDRDLQANRMRTAKKAGTGKPRKQPAKKPNKQPEPDVVAMTVADLARLLDVLEAGHPDAVVLMDGRPLAAVGFRADLGRDGKAIHAVVELKSEEIHAE